MGPPYVTFSVAGKGGTQKGCRMNLTAWMPLRGGLADLELVLAFAF